jgi:hypothetical protein
MTGGQLVGALVAALAALSCGSTKAKSDPSQPPTDEPAINTVPFEGGVYAAITPDSLSNGVVRRFWPTDGGREYSGFRLGALYFGFRPTDGQLFYMQLGSGIYIDDAIDDQDTVIPTPPCVLLPGDPFPMQQVTPIFGFDGQGTLHYDCDAAISRGDGIVIHSPAGFSAVLADGRVLLVEGNDDPWSTHFVVRSATGELLTSLELPLHEPLFRTATVQGNDAFVLLARHEDMMVELDPVFDLVMYRLDPSSKWLPMRTVSRPPWRDYLPLSDGTILSFYDKSLDDRTPVVTAWLPDGRTDVIWEADPEDRRTANSILVGPQ